MRVPRAVGVGRPPPLAAWVGRESSVVELVRVLATETQGTPGAVRAAEARYRLLIALTEVHLGGPVPERRAWWGDALESVDTVREEGIDVRAATTWSVSGSWERLGLLARREGHDELGAPLPLDSGDPGATVEGGYGATVGAVAAG